MFKTRAFFFLSLTLLTSLISITGCRSTKPEYGTISGSVELINDTGNNGNDPVDFSNVSVALYELAQIDSTVSSINTDFPQIGVLMTQETEFFHIDSAPVMVTDTTPDGNFTLINVPYGAYNVVFQKDGWGYIYRYDVSVTPEERDRIITDVMLYPLVHLSMLVEAPFTFERDHHYSATGDVTFLNNCTFQGGSFVEIAHEANLMLNGNITVNIGGGFTKFLPVSTRNKSSLQRWNTIRIMSNGQSISNMLFKGANTGLSLFGDDCSVTSVYITESDNGIYVEGQDVSINHSLFRDILSKAVLYVQAENNDAITQFIEESIVYNCYEGTRTHGQPVRIKNNYFVDNNSAVFSNHNYHIIENNVFDRNDDAIICAGTTITLQYNTFLDNINSVTFAGGYITGYSQPIINNNNFYQTTGYAVKMQRLPTQSPVIDATLNYWQTEIVDLVIYDNHDDSNIYQTVDYLPKRNQAVSLAGIQT